MSIFTRLFRRESKSAGFEALVSAALSGQVLDLGGSRVTPETAMRVPAVRACVAAIAESIAGLPLHLYRRIGSGAKERAVDHPLYQLLHAMPNDGESAYEFRREMQADLLLHGQCYAHINRLGDTIAELTRIPPRQVAIDSDGTYRVTQADGTQRRYQPEDIFSLSALGGLSPVALASEAINLASLLETHGSRLFAAGAKPGGLLETDSALSDVAMQRLANSFQGNFAGAVNAGRTVILEEGLKFKQLTLSSTDAQFLEHRKFQVAEIARAFRVPLHKIGELDRATFSNIEHQALEFVTDTIMPWVKLWEGGIRRSLLSPDERREYFAEFLVDDLARGDLKSRYEAFATASLNGFMTINEIRAAENRPPLPGGDVPRAPLNTAPLGADPDA